VGGGDEEAALEAPQSPAAPPGQPREGKIHRADPGFGPTLTVSNRDSQSNRWVNLKSMGHPCACQVTARWARGPRPRRTWPR
jgi:hypothetical protein